jgi:hypothetical protein
VTWLYIIILWADMAQPRPVPFPTMQACRQAAQKIRDEQDNFRNGSFMGSISFYCVSTPPQDVEP